MTRTSPTISNHMIIKAGVQGQVRIYGCYHMIPFPPSEQADEMTVKFHMIHKDITVIQETSLTFR
jgi:hypothetical protein